MSEIKNIEAVGALVVCAEVPNHFIGVRHTQTKLSSFKLKSQLAIPTETVREGEEHQAALERMWQEELFVEHLFGPVNLLNTFQKETVFGEVKLTNYLYYACRDSVIKILDGEIADFGWVKFDQVLKSSEAWWIRSGVFETVTAYQRWQTQGSLFFQPDLLADTRDKIPHELLGLLARGLDEATALQQLGLVRGQERLWNFADRVEYQ